MPRVAADSKHLFTFIKGLITEATGITYPENSMVDGDNVDIGVSGICQRRKGFDFEEGYSLSAELFTADEIATNAITVHEWRSVNGNGSLNFWVLQVGTKLYIGTMGTAALSDGFLGIIDLSLILALYVDPVGIARTQPFIINTEQARFHPMDSSYGKGRLFLTSKFTNPFYLEFDADASALTIRMVHMFERDFEGVEDNLAVDSQPTGLSGNHAYNLLNQGWNETVNTGGSTAGFTNTTLLISDLAVDDDGTPTPTPESEGDEEEDEGFTIPIDPDFILPEVEGGDE